VIEFVIDSKVEARQRAVAVRKAAHAVGAGAAKTACERFLAAGLSAKSATVSGYRPIRTEIDPTPLMIALNQKGHRLCVPVIRGSGRPLEFREWWPGVEMTRGAFGAEIPLGTDVLIPDILITPLLAFDRQRWRLGYGGGFYDRTLAGLRAVRPIRAIGFAYSAQEMSVVPREPTDQPLDAVVTEREAMIP